MNSRNERRRKRMEIIEQRNKHLLEQNKIMREYLYELEMKHDLLKKEYDRYVIYVTIMLIILTSLYVYLMTL